jgi:creatinine amidohydrolase
MMALDATCSDMTRLPSKDEPGCHWAMGRNAYDSDRRVGERMVRDEVNYLGEKIKELLTEYERIKPKHTLRTFEDVEHLWKTIIVPQMKNFLCLQTDFQGKEQMIPKDSVWYENSRNPDSD